MFSIGLMSGTSMDGIDAALVETDGSPNLLNPIAHISLRYSSECRLLLKAAEFIVRHFDGDCDKADAHFEATLPIFFEQALALPTAAWQSQYDRMAKALHHELHLLQGIPIDDDPILKGGINVQCHRVAFNPVTYSSRSAIII